MKKAWITGALCGLGAGLVVLASAGLLHAQGQAGLTGKVASIDVQTVFYEYQRYKDAQEELEATQSRLQEESDNRKAAADRIEAAAQQMQPNAPERIERMEEALKARIEHQVWFQYKEAQLKREIAVVTESIYREILESVRATAENNGYDLVVYYNDFVPGSIDPDQLQAQIATRRIVYVNSNGNMTQSVLDTLNQTYRSKPRQPQLNVP